MSNSVDLATHLLQSLGYAALRRAGAAHFEPIGTAAAWLPIEDGRLEGVAELEINASDSQVMICGNLDMIKDTVEVLNKRGLVKNKRREPGQITTEKYW